MTPCQTLEHLPHDLHMIACLCFIRALPYCLDSKNRNIPKINEQLAIDYPEMSCFTYSSLQILKIAKRSNIPKFTLVKRCKKPDLTLADLNKPDLIKYWGRPKFLPPRIFFCWPRGCIRVPLEHAAYPRQASPSRLARRIKSICLFTPLPLLIYRIACMRAGDLQFFPPVRSEPGLSRCPWAPSGHRSHPH